MPRPEAVNGGGRGAKTEAPTGRIDN